MRNSRVHFTYEFYNNCYITYAYTVSLAIRQVRSKLSLRAQWLAKVQNFLHANSRRLWSAWAFTVHIRPKARFCIAQPIYSRTSMARTLLGPWKIVRAMGSSSQWRLVMAPGREANIANSGKSINLLHNYCMLSVLIRIASKKRF